MRFHEKLRRRVAELELNKSKAARDVGLPESTISNYLVKEQSLPRIDIAMKIARAIKVPLEWLADDAAGWPPPEKATNTSPLQLSDRDLMLEVARRHRLSTIRLLDAIDTAEKIDWAKASSTEPYAKLLAAIMPVYYWSEMLTLYNPDTAARQNHQSLPGADRPATDFSGFAIADRVAKILGNAAFRETAAKLMAVIPETDFREIERDMQWAGARERERFERTGERFPATPIDSAPPTSSPSSSSADPAPPPRASETSPPKSAKSSKKPRNEKPHESRLPAAPPNKSDRPEHIRRSERSIN